MIEEENEKVYRFFTIILLFIQGFIIGIFCIFFVAVSKVKAADYQTLNPTSIQNDLYNSSGSPTTGKTCQWNDLSNCNISLDTTSNQRSRILFKSSYYASANNSIQVNYVVGYKMVLNGANPQDVNINYNNVTVKYYSDATLIKDISGDCSTSANKVEGITGIVPIKNVYYIFTTTCDFINPGANANYIQIDVPLPTSITNITNVYSRISSYTLNRITGTINDSDKIIANNNQNTQWIINNINGGLSSVVSGVDSAKEDIINNQNDNTDRLEDAIKNQNIKCIDYNKNYNNKSMGDEGYFTGTGAINTTSNNWYHTHYIPVEKGKTYTITKSYSGGGGTGVILYDENKTFTNMYTYNDNSNTSVIITPSFNGYIRFSFSYINGQNRTTTLTGEYCYNIIEKGQEDTTNSVNDIKDSITDFNVDINNLPSVQINTGPISAILSMPVELAISVLNGIDGTCHSYTIGSLFGHTLTLPCINIPSIIGQNLWTTIDIIISGIFAFSFRRKLIDLWNALIHLRTAKIGSDEL